MMRPTTQLLLIICLFLSVSIDAFSQAEQKANKSILEKIGYSRIKYLAVHDTIITIGQARKHFNDGDYQTNSHPDINLGIAKDDYWVHFEFIPPHPEIQKWYVNLENPRLNEVEVFVIRGDSILKHFLLGDFLPFSQRALYYNQFAFPIDTKGAEGIDIFLYIHHKGNTLQVPVSVMDEKTFYSSIEGNYLGTGITTGILLIAFFFGIFFLFNTRDKLFFYYSGYAILMAAWLWATEGYAFQYLWPDTPVLATRVGPSMSVLAICFFIMSCLEFTKPYDDGSLMRRVLWSIVFFFLFWGLLPVTPFVPILRPEMMATFLSVHFVMNLVAILLASFYLLRIYLRGNTVVLYYFLAVIVSMACSFILVARHSGWISIPVSSGALMSGGIVLEVILMTAGITKLFYKYKQEKEATLLAYLEQQKSITQKILQTQEMERRRIGQELHDDIGSGLTQIALMSEAAIQYARSSRNNSVELDDIVSTSRKLVNSMGEIIWSLTPENKNLPQLLAYLREQLNKLLEYSGMNYTIDFPSALPAKELNNGQLRNTLLITKEIVHNAVKHSQAKNISIVCTQEINSLHFEITDNGIGLDPEKKNQGNGLRNIRHRLKSLGGSLTITSTPGNGSTFVYDIPW